MADELVYVCEICQSVMEVEECRAVCRNCGRTVDCTDLALFLANAKVDPETHRLTLRPGADPRDLLPTGRPAESPVDEAGASDNVANLP